MLAKEQYIGVLVLSVIAVSAWVFVTLYPSAPDYAMQEAERQWAVRDSLRRDSIARVRFLRDSLREARWEHKKDSFHRADSLRFAAWSRERQARFDSFRIADSLWRDSVGWTRQRTVKKDTVLSLNTADTTELTLIRGIGRYTARRIIAYREQLGGFYSPLQLTDEALRDLHLDTLVQHFTASPDSIKQIDVNRSTAERLSRHPYIRYEQARAIYRLRRNRLQLKGMDDLRHLQEIDSTDIRRLQYYLRFD